MSAEVRYLARMCDGWNAAPTPRAASATLRAPRNHRLRLLPIGDGYGSARDGDRGDTREFHPYGLMVWSAVD